MTITPRKSPAAGTGRNETAGKEQAQPAGKVKQDTKRTYEEEKEWKKKERQRLRRIEEIEAAVSSAEEKISANEELLCDPDVYQDHEKYRPFTRRMKP